MRATRERGLDRAGGMLLALFTVAALPAAADDAADGSSAPARAQAREPADRCDRLKPGVRSAGDVVRLRPDPDVDARDLAAAVADWKRCPAYGTGFPRFELDGSEGRVVRVVRTADVQSDACGTFRGDTITLRRSARIPTLGVVACTASRKNLTHELGHVLGLADASTAKGCERAIMARMPARRPDRRAVSDEECELVDQRWRTTPEAGSEEKIATSVAASDSSDVPPFH